MLVALQNSKLRSVASVFFIVLVVTVVLYSTSAWKFCTVTHVLSHMNSVMIYTS